MGSAASSCRNHVSDAVRSLCQDPSYKPSGEKEVDIRHTGVGQLGKGEEKVEEGWEFVIAAPSGDSTQTEVEAANSANLVAALEQRQEAILSRLNELKETLDQLAGRHRMPIQSNSLCSALPIVRSTPTSSAVSSVHTESVLGKGIVDIVMHADPNQPPLSLFVLYEKMKSMYQVLATSYVHSSVISVDKKLTTAFQNASASRRSQNQLALSFIWKKVNKDPELVVSPGQQIPIKGEANIARYLNRVMDSNFDNRDIVTATQVDEWLDIAQLQLIHGNSKERAAAVRSLNSRLGRNEWLVGSSLSLADIVTWSAVHQAQQADSAPANVKKWLKACVRNPNFKLAESLLL